MKSAIVCLFAILAIVNHVYSAPADAPADASVSANAAPLPPPDGPTLGVVPQGVTPDAGGPVPVPAEDLKSATFGYWGGWGGWPWGWGGGWGGWGRGWGGWWW